MKTLWLLVAALGLVYLAVYGITKQTKHAPPIPAQNQVIPNAQQQLTGIATGDVISRVSPKAKTKIVSVAPKRLAGDDLHEVSFADSSGTVGFEIIVSASVDEKEVGRFKYHAIPPNKVVFVETVK